MYSSDIILAVAVERRRRYRCEAAKPQRSARRRREARGNPKLASPIYTAFVGTGC
jgi:hypothetical protein